jgi:protein AFG1
MKLEHGNDIDGVPFVAADIAEKGNVLCFDEFQCTDVADAMILRRYVPKFFLKTGLTWLGFSKL